jgi:hypothetical protein
MCVNVCVRLCMCVCVCVCAHMEGATYRFKVVGRRDVVAPFELLKHLLAGGLHTLVSGHKHLQGLAGLVCAQDSSEVD